MEDQGYLQVIEYDRKEKSIFSKETLILAILLLFLVATTFILSIYVTEVLSSVIILLLMVVYAIFPIIIYFDTYTGNGALYDRRNQISSFLFLGCIGSSSSVIIIYLLGSLIEAVNEELVVGLIFAVSVLSPIVSTYLIYKGNPSAFIESLSEKFSEIKEDLREKRVSEMGLSISMNKSIAWLKQNQSKSGGWESEKNNNLYSTAEILYTLYNLGGVEFAWRGEDKSMKKNEKSLEEIFHYLLESLPGDKFLEGYEKMFVLIVIDLFDISLQDFSLMSEEEVEKAFKDAMKIEVEDYENLKQQVSTRSPWDFITDLEKLNIGTSRELPSYFGLGQVAVLRNELDLAQNVLNILGETLNIVIARGGTRFSKIKGDKSELKTYIISVVYNTIIEMLRLNEFILIKKKQVFNETSNKTDDAEGLVLPDPNIDFSLNLDNLDDPSLVPSISSSSFADISSDDTGKLRLETRLSTVRSYLHKLQGIDGSWDADPLTTAECILSISHEENVESDTIKLALNFLLATQKKNGSWGDDFVVTARIIRIFNEIVKNLILK